MQRESSASIPARTTGQSLGSLLKSARDIMRKDKGLNGDTDRLPMLTWIMFLKFLDDLELQREDEAALAGAKFRPAIESPYRWRDWAAKGDGITGDELLSFINQDDTIRPDGTAGKGLFAYLQSRTSANGDDRRDVIATVFRGVDNRMRSGYLLRDVINKVSGIHFTSSEELHTLGTLYESMLREMRDAAGDSGEFYTPRPVVRFMVGVINPRLGERVLDPASGTGGFLVEAFKHLGAQVRTVAERRLLQEQSLRGCEPKPLPYLLCQMNLLLHGLDAPQIDSQNALRFTLSEIGEKDRVDVILTNPPFGGEEERGIQNNFPEDRRTSETALLFLQLIMRRLRRGPKERFPPARAAVVVPHAVLSADGVAHRIRLDLLKEFNLHTIVRLPRNVFAPYTDLETNILVFERRGATREILFCEPTIPENVNLSKTKPLLFEWLDQIRQLIDRRATSSRSWLVQVDELDENLNLDIKNPNIVLTELQEADSLENLAAHLSTVSQNAKQLQQKLDAIIPTINHARNRPLGELTDESDERIGSRYSPEINLVGVSADEGLSLPKTPVGKSPERYKVLRHGFLAYNPMRINIGSIGVVRSKEEEGITSPDYVVFSCRNAVLPEFVYHFLRSEPGLHAIKQKTKGSVRFRLYYDRLALITIPCPDDIDLQREFVEACNQLEALQKQIKKSEELSRRCLYGATLKAFLIHPNL
jgi:type I restriction enzyme M protein